ncbi:MAG: hypothetical protein IJ033_04615 [Clostridia bacterium]|nr:hypothetical protein [Clostridia bacterium]
MKWFKSKKQKQLKESFIAPSQSDRIESLKAEVYRLECRLDEYVKREREITEVLSFAKARAEEYEKEAKLRYMLERERLSTYREKWRGRLKSLSDADRLGEEILECNECFKRISAELKSIVEGTPMPDDEVESSYFNEQKRLSEIGVTDEVETMLSEEDLNKLLLQFNC